MWSNPPNRYALFSKKAACKNSIFYTPLISPEIASDSFSLLSGTTYRL
jgi:hypothetical protein